MKLDPIEDYLNQLRAGLLAPPGETRLILAEAEDHLRESIAAGVAAGLTEREATQAAISSFGSVRAVIRAHRFRHGRAVAVLGDLALVAWKLAAVFLIAVFAWGLGGQVLAQLVTYPSSFFNSTMRHRELVLHPNLVGFASGAVGLALLGGFALYRRRHRSSGQVRPALLGGYSSLVGAIIFAILAAVILRSIAMIPAVWLMHPPEAGWAFGGAFGGALLSATGCVLVLGWTLPRRIIAARRQHTLAVSE